MIVDKIKNYLNGRSDIKYEELPIFLDKSNFGVLVERHPIRVFAPINKNDMLPLHYLHEMDDYAEKFYIDLKNNTGIEKLKLIGSIDNKIDLPRIIYRNGSEQTEILIKYNGKEFNEKGKYIKELDIEFF